MNELVKNKTSITATVCTFLFGLLVHSFFLNNVLKNYDATIITGFGADLSSGRWLLGWIGGHFSEIWGDYNIPYFTGVVALLVISICVGLFIHILQIKKTWIAILLGAIFVTFPSTFTTLLFTYTTLFYAFAILTMAGAVWCTELYKYGFLLGGFLIACGMGIYQAYLPFAISLFVLLGVRKLYLGKDSIKEVLLCGLKYIGTIILGLAFYYVLLHWRLWHTGTELSDYRGINSVEIQNPIHTIVKTFALYFNPAHYHYTRLALSKITIAAIYLSIAFWIVCVVFMGARLWKREKGRTCLFIVSNLLLPIAFNSVYIMCDDVSTLMGYALVFVYWVPLVYYGWIRESRDKVMKIVPILLSANVVIAVLNYGYMANGCYANMYYSNEQAKAYLNSVFTQVRNTEGFTTDKKWVVIGKDFQDPMYENPWNVQEFMYGGSELNMTNGYFRDLYIQQFLGMHVNMASAEERVGVIQKMGSMPCYPNYGSIRIVDEYVVLKIDEE